MHVSKYYVGTFVDGARIAATPQRRRMAFIIVRTKTRF